MPAVLSREQPGDLGLAVRDVTVSFGGITALDNVSVDVSKGEVLGVIGPNGAGKTTLVKSILGALRPRSGLITFRGEPIQGQSADKIVSKGIAIPGWTFGGRG